MNTYHQSYLLADLYLQDQHFPPPSPSLISSSTHMHWSGAGHKLKTWDLRCGLTCCSTWTWCLGWTRIRMGLEWGLGGVWIRMGNGDGLKWSFMKRFYCAISGEDLSKILLNTLHKSRNLSPIKNHVIWKWVWILI